MSSFMFFKYLLVASSVFILIVLVMSSNCYNQKYSTRILLAVSFEETYSTLLIPFFEINLQYIHIKRPGAPHYRGFTITLRLTIRDRTSLHERSARLRDLYPTTYNTRKRLQTSVLLAGFEPLIPEIERPQGHALDSAVTGIGCWQDPASSQST